MDFDTGILKDIFRPRVSDSHKGTYGYIALIGGSLMYSGAIRLAALAAAAARSGAGVVTVAVPESIAPVVASHVLVSTIYPLTDEEGAAGHIGYAPEQIDTLMRRRKAIAFGMGVGTGSGARRVLRHLLENYEGRLLIDADGLNILAEDMELLYKSKAKIVLTPHLMEFSRLSGLSLAEIEADKEGTAKDFAAHCRLKGADVTLLLKGPVTVVTDGEEIIPVKAGCPGMASGGSGDVLSGIATAMLGYSTQPVLWTVAAAAYVNGRAGELAQALHGDISMTAADTVMQIEDVIKETRS